MLNEVWEEKYDNIKVEDVNSVFKRTQLNYLTQTLKKKLNRYLILTKEYNKYAAEFPLSSSIWNNNKEFIY